MKTITPRALYTDIPTETTMVVVDGSLVGLFIPLTEEPVLPAVMDEGVEVKAQKAPKLGEVTPAGPVAPHRTQDELDAARAARSSDALNEARRAAQAQRDKWLKKMPSTGRGGGA